VAIVSDVILLMAKENDSGTARFWSESSFSWLVIEVFSFLFDWRSDFVDDFSKGLPDNITKRTRRVCDWSKR